MQKAWWSTCLNLFCFVKDMVKSNGLLFLSLSKRRNVFPDCPAEKRRFIPVSRWQGDVLEGGDRLTIQVPVATENGKEKLRTEQRVQNNVSNTWKKEDLRLNQEQ